MQVDQGLRPLTILGKKPWSTEVQAKDKGKYNREGDHKIQLRIALESKPFSTHVPLLLYHVAFVFVVIGVFAN